MRATILVTGAWLAMAVPALAQDSGEKQPAPAEAPAAPPVWLADRGPGIHTSLFGTYVEEHQLLVYGFYEYTVNSEEEYNPNDWGAVLDQDFRAKREDHEALLFLSYGFTADLMLEFESALFAQATQRTARNDVSGRRVETERGLGDTEGQLRWRFLHEAEKWPELIGYFEFVFPLQRRRNLIGTSAWEFEWGVQVTKGFPFGTFGAKLALAYSGEDEEWELGEFSIEYVKRLSPQWRVVAAIEGEIDELAAIVEVQWSPVPRVTFKFNSGFQLTPPAPDWAPEVGVLLRF